MTKNNITVRRPAIGLEPKYFEILVGKQVPRNVKKGESITFDLLFGEK